MTFPPYYFGETFIGFAGKMLRLPPWKAKPFRDLLEFSPKPVVVRERTVPGQLNTAFREAGIPWHVESLQRDKLYRLVPDGYRGQA